MTVEALMVNGAEERTELRPSKLAYTPRVLAEPGREYSLMTKRNMFTGIPTQYAAPERRLTEDKADVLRFVKLTMIYYNPDRRRWEATIYDQGAGPRRTDIEDDDGVKKGVETIWERKLNTLILNKVQVSDRNNNSLFDGQVVLIDERQVVLKADDKFIRLRCGDSLFPAVNKPLSANEVKELGLGGGAE